MKKHLKKFIERTTYAFRATMTILMAVALLTPLAALADTVYSTTTAAGTAANIFAGQKRIASLTLINSTGSAVSAKFFDSSSTTTNYIRLAYSDPLTYSTNYNVITTNSSGILLTNSFEGIFTTYTTVTSNTIVRPAYLTVTVPANAIRTWNTTYTPIFGSTVVANGVLTVETTTSE